MPISQGDATFLPIFQAQTNHPIIFTNTMYLADYMYYRTAKKEKKERKKGKEEKKRMKKQKKRRKNIISCH
jgi:hypothetical protein